MNLLFDRPFYRPMCKHMGYTEFGASFTRNFITERFIYFGKNTLMGFQVSGDPAKYMVFYKDKLRRRSFGNFIHG